MAVTVTLGNTDISNYVKSLSITRSVDIGKNLLEVDISTNYDTLPDSGTMITVDYNLARVFSGWVTGFPYSMGAGTNGFKITAADSSIDLFATQIDVSETSKTASEIILKYVKLYAQNINASLTTDGGHITPTTHTIDYYGKHAARLYEILFELSANSYTGNGNFTFFVDENNNLHFCPLDTSSISSKIISYNRQLNTSGKFNTIVLYCGDNPVDGTRMLNTYVSAKNLSLFNGRSVIRYFSETGIARKLENSGLYSTASEYEEAARDLGRKYADFYFRFKGSSEKKVKIVVPLNFDITPGKTFSSSIGALSSDLWKILTVKHTIGKVKRTEITAEKAIL